MSNNNTPHVVILDYESAEVHIYPITTEQYEDSELLEKYLHGNDEGDLNLKPSQILFMSLKNYPKIISHERK